MCMCVSCNLSTYLNQALGGPDGVGFGHGVGKVGKVGRVDVGEGVGLLGGNGCRAVAG